MDPEDSPEEDPLFEGKPTQSALPAFLSDPSKTKARELMLTSRLTHDLMTAAAFRGYDLLVYSPTVDSDGFDLIVDDRDKLLPLQVKSVLSTAKTGSWNIHRRVLKPPVWLFEALRLGASTYNEGKGGGVVLITVFADEAELQVKYSYTSLFILHAFWQRALNIKRQSTSKAVDALRVKIFSESAGTVPIPRSAFVQAKSPEHLLALMGLHSRYHLAPETNIIQVIQEQWNVAPKDVLLDLIARQFAYLCDLPKTVVPFKRLRVEGKLRGKKLGLPKSPPDVPGSGIT